MTTAWDISTASYDSIDFDDGDLVGPVSIQFNNDGSKLYFGRSLNDRIWEVAL
jgi:sugar lactone lactonase YvrE